MLKVVLWSAAVLMVMSRKLDLIINDMGLFGVKLGCMRRLRDLCEVDILPWLSY